MDRCFRNGILKSGKQLESKNGQNKLRLQNNGNLELACGKNLLWSTDTKSDDVDFLYFSKTGNNLLLRGKSNSTMWKAKFNGLAEKLILQDDGNLVLYDKNEKIVWATKTKKKCLSKWYFI